jgi:capsular exopolysaccharide synthesis family protein
MDFWRVIEILNKRKWLILSSVIVALILTGVALRMVGGRWTATVQFVSGQLLPSEGEGQAGEDTMAGQAALQADMTAYSSIIKSRDVLELMRDKLHLGQIPPDILDAIDFQSNGPRTYQLQVTDKSRARAILLVNGLADSFVEVNHRIYTAQATKVVRLLQDQLKAADAALLQTHRQYDQYCSENHIMGGDVKNDLQPVLIRLEGLRQRREELAEKLTGERERLSHEKVKLTEIPKTLSQTSTAGESPEIKQLQDDLAKAQKNLDAAEQHYTPQSQSVLDAQAERDKLLANLKDARKNQTAATSLPNPAYGVFQDEVNDLQQQVTDDQAKISQIDATIPLTEAEISQRQKTDSPLGILLNTMNQQTDARNNLALRLNSAQRALDTTEQQNPLTVMNRPSEYNPPTNLRKGRTTKLMVMAALCALLFSSGLAIAHDSIDKRLKTVQEAEGALPTRVLAAIPQPIGSTTYASIARATELNPQSLHAEAYRFLGLHLLNERFPRIRSLMVLAAKAEQGSTTTLTNLGITLAQSGKQVIIVDANVRTPEIHQVFGLRNEWGFTDLLKYPGRTSLERALHQTSIENLRVIASGPTPANPWEVFRSEAIQEVSESLHQMADYVLYDTPSTLAFTDALNLAHVVDAAFLCVRAQEPLTGAEQRLIELLEQANVTVLGCVLSDVPASVDTKYPAPPIPATLQLARDGGAKNGTEN